MQLYPFTKIYAEDEQGFPEPYRQAELVEDVGIGRADVYGDYAGFLDATTDLLASDVSNVAEFVSATDTSLRKTTVPR